MIHSRIKERNVQDELAVSCSIRNEENIKNKTEHNNGVCSSYTDFTKKLSNATNYSIAEFITQDIK